MKLVGPRTPAGHREANVQALIEGFGAIGHQILQRGDPLLPRSNPLRGHCLRACLATCRVARSMPVVRSPNKVLRFYTYAATCATLTRGSAIRSGGGSSAGGGAPSRWKARRVASAMIVICGLTPSERGHGAAVGHVEPRDAVDAPGRRRAPRAPGRAPARAVPSGWKAISSRSRGAHAARAAARSRRRAARARRATGGEHGPRAGRPVQLGRAARSRA